MAKTPTYNLQSERYSIRKLKGFDPAAADHATMIEDACANALARNEVLWWPSSLPQLFTSRPLTIPAGLDFLQDGQAQLTYTGSLQDQPILIVGTASTANGQRMLRLKMNRQTPSNWADPNHVGILLHNCMDSELDLACSGFTVGIECKSASAGGALGFSYNAIKLRRLVDNRYSLRLNASGDLGWVNENTFYKGRFAISSTRRQDLGYPTTYGPVGVWISGAFNAPNSNVWHQPSFEICSVDSVPSGAGQWLDSTCFLFDAPGCIDNFVHNARHENGGGSLLYNGATFFRFIAPACVGNKATLDYAVGTWREHPITTTDNTPAYEAKKGMIDYRCDDGGGLLNSVERHYNKAATPKSSWHSGNLGSRAKRCNAAGAIMVPGLYWQADGLHKAYSHYNTHTVPSGARHIVLNNSPGAEALTMLIDTSVAKRFSIKPSVVGGGSMNCRVMAVALDASRNLLDNCGAQGSVTVNTSGVITAVTIPGGFGGKGYSAAPAYRIYGGAGSGAVLTVNMTAGVVSSVTVNNGGGGYKQGGGTVIVFDPPTYCDLMLGGSGPSPAFGGACKLTQGNAAAERMVVAGPRTQFIEVGVWTTGGVTHLESIEIRADDGGPLQISNWFPEFWDDRPFALEKPATGWLTNGGTWKPGDFVHYLASPGDTSLNRPAGWLFCGGTVFEQVPRYYVGTTQPTDTDIIWIDTTANPTVVKVYVGGVWR